MDATDAELAAKTRKYLGWAMFMLAAAVAILIIDFQLKKAVAGQARVASKLYTDLVVRFGGTEGPETPPADGGRIGGGGSGDHVDGTPPGSADHAAADGAGEAASFPSPRRAPRGAPRDGQ